MREILSVILRGCELARDLQAHLPDMAGQPQLLLDSCKAIAADFNHAVDRLRSDQHAVVLFGDQASGSGTHPGRAGEEDSLVSDLVVSRAMDLLNTKVMEEESTVLFARALPESDVVGGASEIPELGLEIPTTSALGIAEFGSSSGGTAGHAGSTGIDRFAAGVSGQTAMMAMAASDSGGRAPVGYSAQRSSRKRKGSGETWTKRVPALRPGNIDIPPDDSHTWRKYGQKDILGSRFPRSYYRCTHKNFYGCEAKKQVQRLDDDPYTYEVTYCGQHSCQTSPTPYLTIANGASGEPRSEQLAGISAPPLILAQAPDHPASLSMSVRVGSSWFSAAGEASLQKDDHKPGHNNIGLHDHRGSPPLRSGGNGGAEFPVADLADVMFNSRGSGHSMDAIFSSKQFY